MKTPGRVISRRVPHRTTYIFSALRILARRPTAAAEKLVQGRAN